MNRQQHLARSLRPICVTFCLGESSSLILNGFPLSSPQSLQLLIIVVIKKNKSKTIRKTSLFFLHSLNGQHHPQIFIISDFVVVNVTVLDLILEVFSNLTHSVISWQLMKLQKFSSKPYHSTNSGAQQSFTGWAFTPLSHIQNH